MEGKVFVIMVISGLCALPSCSPHQYHFVAQLKTWTEAQSYCRNQYTDLAPVASEDDVANLTEALGRHDGGQVWIGLYDDINSWRWSLQNESYYGEGEAEFRMWDPTEPHHIYTENCAFINWIGTWGDVSCHRTLPFFCYNGARGCSRFVFVNKTMTWTEAQSYCRRRYTDLVSVRNQTENDEMKNKVPHGYTAWIGLFRDSWKWSDGSDTSFRNWNAENKQPAVGTRESCVATRFGKWENLSCSLRNFFACYSAVVTKQVVKLRVTSDSSVDLEDLNEALLQQLHQRLKAQGLKDVELRWVTQPDGKVFHLEESEEEEESCNLK